MVVIVPPVSALMKNQVGSEVCLPQWQHQKVMQNERMKSGVRIGMVFMHASPS